MNTSLLSKSVAKKVVGLLIASRTAEGAEEQIMLLLQQHGIDYLLLNRCFEPDEMKGFGQDSSSFVPEESFYKFEISYYTEEEERALLSLINNSHIDPYIIPTDRNQVLEVVKKKQQGQLFLQGELMKEGEYSVIQQIADEFCSWYRIGSSLREDMNLKVHALTDDMTVNGRVTPIVSKETMKELMITLFDMMDAKLLTAEEFLYRYNASKDRYEAFMKSDVYIPSITVQMETETKVGETEADFYPKGDYDKWTVTWMLESGGHYNAPFDTAQEALEQVEELQKEGVDATLITVFEPHVNISLDKLKQYAGKNE